MALTSNSDLYAAIRDEGINRVDKHIMRQRPSLFNYGTILVKSNPSLLCSCIDAAPGVTELITLLPRVPTMPWLNMIITTGFGNGSMSRG
ncbi:MAG TPA: hypothetical protein VF350_01525 [Candidatus Bathyarchaeia archaeon]